MPTVRPELPEDYPTVFEINTRTFMVAELRPGALRGIAGLVTYLPEFSQV
ncbi:MAG: hypothetical protein HYZ50_02005 [Deltaproteobacteria bacterium]|nr:hypothetical protein [Deltaproteobacteria bacterium]